MQTRKRRKRKSQVGGRQLTPAQILGSIMPPKYVVEYEPEEADFERYFNLLQKVVWNAVRESLRAEIQEAIEKHVSLDHKKWRHRG